MENLVRPAVIAELEHRDMTIGRSAGKQTSGFMRSPGNHVHRGGMKGEVEDFRPSTTANRGSGALVLLAPDKHFSIVGRRCENCAELGVCLLCGCARVSLDGVRYMPILIFQPDDSLYTYPFDTPYWTLMAVQVHISNWARLAHTGAR